MQSLSALYRFDAAVSREYYAQLKEAQGHFIGARKFRKRGQDRGEMACGNNNVRQSCTHTAHWPAVQAVQRQHHCLCSVQARCSSSISYTDVGPAGVCFTAQRRAR